MYSIGEVAEKFDISVSAIRFYDKKGLFSEIKKVNGVRKFTEEDVNKLFYIMCLKKSGMKLREIKQFMDYVKKGNQTLEKRLKMITDQAKKVEAEIKEKEKIRDLLSYKTWYYQEAIKFGDEKAVKSLVPDKMPEDIKQKYLNATANKD